MLVIALSFATGLLAVSVTRLVFSRRHVLDVPVDRSSHTAPIVRGGGVGVAVAVGIGFLLVDEANRIPGFVGLLTAAMGFLFIGLVEDLWRDQSVLLRLGAQAAVGSVATVDLLTRSGLHGFDKWAMGVVVVVWMVSFTNVFNFMDGVNGISAIEAMVAAGAFSVLGVMVGADDYALVAAVVAASALSFLPFNFPRATVFLGDAGSYLLGSLLGGLVVVGARNEIGVIALATPLVPYVADSSLTLLRRILRGERWWTPHRQHIYQQLVDAGWSHARTALCVGAVSLVCAVSGVVGQELGGVAWAVPIVVSTAVTTAYLRLPGRIVRVATP